MIIYGSFHLGEMSHCLSQRLSVAEQNKLIIRAVGDMGSSLHSMSVTSCGIYHVCMLAHMLHACYVHELQSRSLCY